MTVFGSDYTFVLDYFIYVLMTVWERSGEELAINRQLPLQT